jgi:Domain of unknown function (DUF5666)
MPGEVQDSFKVGWERAVGLLDEVLKKPSSAYEGRHRPPGQDRNEENEQLAWLPEQEERIMNDNEATGSTERIPGRGRRLRRSLVNRRGGRMAAAALMCAVVALPVGFATSASATAAPAPASSSAGGGQAPSGAGHAPAGGGSNARSAPAAGGAAGTVDSVSKSSFTLTTSAGQKVTIDETSSTKYEKGTDAAGASAVTKGASVLVFGTTNSTTITAMQVEVGYTPPTSMSASKVIAFKRGTPTDTKSVGQIPANWVEGQGTIISGTAANEATQAALAAYPGGVVDRVVKLSDGEYDVHYIGVSWPHHVFETASFKVVGAE